MSTKNKLLPQATVHAWNSDFSMLAVSPNSSDVYIYEVDPKVDASKWKKLYELKEHIGLVSGIDWSHVTNKIVTCSHDRNAYVWTFDEEKNVWNHAVSVLRINRAATSVKWSPLGNKFAVTSGSKCVPVCHFEEKNNWWVAKMIRKHKSTVLDLAWCPNNKFLVTGSSDMKCRIFSAYIKALDDEGDDGFGELWPDQHEFGTPLAVFDQAKSWVNGVAWSPNGFRLAFVAQSGTVHFVQLVAGGDPLVQSVMNDKLPYLNVDFLSDESVVVAGYNLNPAVYVDEGEHEWKYLYQLDGKREAKTTTVKKSAFANVMGKWNAAASEGRQFGAGKKKAPTTSHINTITSLVAFRHKPDEPAKSFSTVGLDGRVVLWDLEKMKDIDLKQLGFSS